MFKHTHTHTNQMDIIDYLLSEYNEVPLLDRSLTENNISAEQLLSQQVVGSETSWADTEQELTHEIETAERFTTH